ncbi:MAG: branched-chain amino acid ABC transporter substrate-binding protein [Rickettsiales bacterium]|nr:branched-chain amino acid ABC transporter substrate-binding protein [Rickettsiales bacterium]
MSFLIFLYSSIDSRELSIKQLEERKKEDLERLKEREKRGKKAFSKEINLETKIIFLTKERKIPPVLSNLDPILDDEGYYGVDIAIEDNLTTGRFLGHNYLVEFHKVLLEENLIEEYKKLIKNGEKYFVVDLNAEELKKLVNLVESKNSLIFNVRSKDDSLRNENCRDNLFHIPPSYSMLADSLTQYLVKKKWKKWFLVVGDKKNDKKFADALVNSAEKFNIKIKENKVWDFAADLRRTAQKEVPIFTKGPSYDVLVVADEEGSFGEYLPYRTWDPRPVVGTQGLTPTSWHRTHEQWGATQMQNRFRRKSGRWMTTVDYASWTAVRSIGEAVTRVMSNDVSKVKSYLLGEKFGLGAYKGVKVSFRSWNGQLRQPVLLAAPRSMISVSPQEGYLHPKSELDTLGKDKPESTCNF